MNPVETQRRIMRLEAQVQKLSAAVGVAAQLSTGPEPTTSVLGDFPSKLQGVLNNGFEWTGSLVDVKPKTTAAITVDAGGVGLKLTTISGLGASSSGLGVTLQTNKGLTVGASGLATLLKVKGGILTGANGLYLDPLMGVVTVLTPGVTVALDFSLGCGFTLTPGQDETLTAANGVPGQRATLIITTSGTTSYDLTFTTNFKTQGVLATGTDSGKIFVMSFFTPDGITWYETERTVAI